MYGTFSDKISLDVTYFLANANYSSLKCLRRLRYRPNMTYFAKILPENFNGKVVMATRLRSLSPNKDRNTAEEP